MDAVLTAKVDTIESHIDDTVKELQRESPHAVWAALYYCCASRFDYWLRHLANKTGAVKRSLWNVRRAAVLREAVDMHEVAF